MTTMDRRQLLQTAAGAMAGVHVGATLSGGGSVTAAGAESYNSSNSVSQSRNENYNYEGT